jgi:uncharacterized protein (TIGR03435 family)
MEDAYFDVVAKVPEGATRDDVGKMLQSMLAEKFGLKVHPETKMMSGYVLTVAERGARMLLSPPLPAVLPPQPESGKPRRFETDKDGFIIVPPGSLYMMSLPPRDGVSRLTAGRATMADLCGYLSRETQRPVVDETGLKGLYDFRLKFASERIAQSGETADAAPESGLPVASTPAPTLTRAVESQLGLKMQRKMVPADILVIDHIERTPVGN